MTYQEFIKWQRLKIVSVAILRRPDTCSEWDKEANHYQVKIYQDAPPGLDNLATLKFERERFELITFYSKGSGHKEKKYPHRPIRPQLDEVLNSLRSDAEAAQSTFEEFCWSHGYDNDSRRHYSIYLECCEIARQMALLFSRDALQALSEVEPL